jgi:hypothetical protein
VIFSSTLDQIVSCRRRAIMMQQIYVLLIVTLSVLTPVVFGDQEYCYTNDGEKRQTKHYSTKTPYEVARGTDKKYFTVPSK